MCSLKLVYICYGVVLLLCVTFAKVDYTEVVGRLKSSYKVEPLADDKFAAIGRLNDAQHFRSALKQILIPRVAGSAGHRRVRSYICKTFEQLEWTVSLDEFNETVPILGAVTFANIIATLNPNAERYLVLACHYDSKYMTDNEFVGATDSAVPCAMLINLAHVLHEQLLPFRHNAQLSLMLLFFDGEEAFEQWGPNDSIYGARHLAQKWETQQFLDKIDMLVLLDLIGAPDPQFYSYFAATQFWYSRLIAIEERLAMSGLLDHYTGSGMARQLPNRYFQTSAMRNSFIEDDHIPFLKRNVPIIHVIPIPFPAVWHTKDDNAAAIDYATIENISRIIRLFTMEYLLAQMA